jgi:hypothetical protein
MGIVLILYTHEHPRLMRFGFGGIRGKGKYRRKMSKMKFFCAFYSNDKKILYLINDKKKRQPERHEKLNNFISFFSCPSTNNANLLNNCFALR